MLRKIMACYVFKSFIITSRDGSSSREESNLEIKQYDIDFSSFSNSQDLKIICVLHIYISSSMINQSFCLRKSNKLEKII